MKVHFTIEFPTRSGEPVDYENDVDVMNPKVTMQPEVSDNNHIPIQKSLKEQTETPINSSPVDTEEYQDEIQKFQERMKKGEIDKEELEQTIEDYQKKNLDLVGKLHTCQMENAKLKAMMKKAPDEQIEELIQENESLKEELKNKVKEQKEENQEDSQYLREEIRDLRSKMKERDERIEKMIEQERESADSIIKYRTQAEQVEIELKEQKAKMEEKYKHFEELNKYISDLLHEKKKLSLNMDEKETQWKEMKEKLEQKNKGETETLKRIENEVQQKSLEDNQKKWDEFQKKIEIKETEIERLKSQIKLADQALNKEGEDVIVVKQLGETVLLKLEELEDICEIMNIDFNRTDINEIRKQGHGLQPVDYAKYVHTNLKIIGDRQQTIYNHLRG